MSLTTTDAIAKRAQITAPLVARFPGLCVMKESPFLLRVHTMIRDIDVNRTDFLFYADQLIRSLIEYTFEVLPYEEKTVVTPTGYQFQGLELIKPLAGISIMRAGESMEAALRATIRDVKIGKLLIQRDETCPQRSAKLFYKKLPKALNEHAVLLLDPMLATGNSVTLAVQVLLDEGVLEEDIYFVNLISTPEGISQLMTKYPKIKVVTSMIDDGLNEKKFIVPGIGDFGDLYFATD